MKRKFLQLLLLMLIKSNLIWAQTTDYTPKIFPPDPSAQLFNKYIDHPVSLNTGLIDVSIPLYNFKEYGFDIPIKLNYYTGGIRVDEVASEVGLGWSLRAGGSISRAVKANPDDSAIGYMYSPYTVQQARTGITNVDFNNDLQQLASRDYEPDSFSFNFLNFSGKFFFDKAENTFVQIPKTDLKINFNKDSNNKIISWVLIDDQGNQYFFGKSSDLTRSQVVHSTQSTQVTYSDDGIHGGTSTAEDHILTWHLMEIKNCNGRAIKFFYNESEAFLDVSKTNENFVYNGNLMFEDQGTEYTVDYVKRRITNVTLSKIESENQQVLFNQSIDERLDLPKTKKLQNLIVLNKLGNQVKKVTFDYDYFSSSENTTDLNYAYPLDQYNYRLKLQSINEIDNANVLVAKHTFFYNELYTPNRTSNSQDAWGYYNGQSNVTLIPKLAVSKSFPEYKVANRDINEELSKAFILTKIQFPTGGVVEYEYESNRAGFIENKSIINNFDTKEHKLVGFAPLVGPGGPEESSAPVFENMYREYFSVRNISGLVSINCCIEGCETIPSTNCHYTIKIVGINTSFLQYVYGGDTNLSLPNGDYYIEAVKNGSPVSSIGFFATLEWNEFTAGPEGGERVGGLRVKKILIKEANSPDIIKEYKYLNPLNSQSSGHMYQYPVLYESPHLANDYIGSFKISSNSLAQTSLTGGSFVNYENVTELLPLANSASFNGKTEYIFSIGSLNQPFEFATLAVDKTEKNLGWQEGKLLNEKKYSFKNNLFNLIEETINEYETLDQKTIENFGVLFDYKLTTSNGQKWYRFTFYPLQTGRCKLIKSTQKNYFSNTTLVEKIMNFQYYTNTDLLKNRTSTTSRLNETLTTNYFYPINTEMANKPFVNELVTKNRIGTPLVTQTLINSVKLSVQEIVFDNSASTSNLLLPKYIYSNKGAAVITDADKKITYDQYDAKGNLVQYTPEAGVPVTIIWGYNKTQPIAKIENAAYASINPSLITAAQTTSDTGTEDSLLAALTALRTGLPNAMVTTYTHKPIIGVSTITDPKGDKITYTYDSFSRLQKVKDKEGNILSENEYHYKN
ncbi:RHS repeat domain-containing protein [Flavobacterium sp.]|uniref:RHS repeat domain-containing protein n=1 Tax=Flavobacterium sp. TaxID=239 RepID=UPI0025D0A3B8|nr:RHS repeat domain-containing protein [Flavobacterium sp.]